MKIYISSTYLDLREHRLAVANVLRRMGHQVIGMEEYVAEGVRPLQRCLADVDNCDTYVGIVAWRYGHLPTDTDLDVELPPGTGLGRTSVTEFEFRRAKQRNKPLLMFLLDPDAEWPSSQMDVLSGSGDHGESVRRYRDEISRDYLLSYFRTPQDLASLVSAAVYRVEMSRQMDLESLHIEARFNSPFVRNGPVSDSTLMEIKNVVAGPEELQGLQINIGQGLDWWMTLLYFLSSLATDLTSLGIIVFVSDGEMFIGTASPRVVRERLAAIHPVLRQYEERLSSSGPAAGDVFNEVERRASLWTAAMGTIGGEQGVNLLVSKRARLCPG